MSWSRVRRRTIPGRPARRFGERAQTLIIFALTLSLLLFGMMVLVIDVGDMLAATAEVARASQGAALAGAADVDTQFYLNPPGGGPPVIRLSPSAVTTCQQAGNQVTGVSTVCTVSGAGITANARRTLTLPIPVPGTATVTTGATYKAFAQAGTNVPK